jgi:hypothetical protein
MNDGRTNSVVPAKGTEGEKQLVNREDCDCLSEVPRFPGERQKAARFAAIQGLVERSLWKASLPEELLPRELGTVVSERLQNTSATRREVVGY